MARRNDGEQTARRPEMGVMARRQVLKASLVAAAEKVIASKGIAGLNARDLAESVGCSLGAIYTVFPDLAAVVRDVNSRTLTLLDSFLAKRARRWSSGSTADPVSGLVNLAEAYLDFAVAQEARWRALFNNAVTVLGGSAEFHQSAQGRLFMLMEKPLSFLRPDLDDKRRMLMARTMFSAVHGIVSLGLDEKFKSLPPNVLADQVRTFVRIVALGLTAERIAPSTRRLRRG